MFSRKFFLEKEIESTYSQRMSISEQKSADVNNFWTFLNIFSYIWKLR